MGSKYTHVFSPIRIRGVEFKNRIVLAPPSPNLAGTDGEVTPEFVDWFRMFARGGVCTLYVGNSSIDITECKDEAYQLDLSDDKCILNLSRYADMCREYDCHASLEINHNGENTAFETVGHAPFSSSPNISSSEKSRAKRLGREPIPAIEMTHEKIKETVEKYAKAAGRMKRAGMDVVLVHGGHGNLISQFTSPLYNHRTDEYGGSTERRARFAIEVCDAIRRECGENFVIEFRISADEIADGGMHFDETLELIGYLRDHIDILHVSAGLHSDFDMAYYRNWCQNYMMERGFNVHYAADIKKRYPDLLVTTVGSITDIDMAEEIIASGKADFVAMCRPLMADPDMPRKYAHDQPEEHRPCLRCDTCTKHLFVPKPIWCAVNPMSGMTSVLRDGVVPKASEKKCVAVIGGGPGGIQAMMTLSDRGHSVTLYEKSAVLGGTVIYAAVPPFKRDCADYLKWLRYQAKKYSETRDVKILMNTEATAEMLSACRYDAVIIATGAVPTVPDVPGAGKKHVMWAPEAEMDKSFSGRNIAIIGAGSVGLEAAIDFAAQGRSVAVFARPDEQRNFSKLWNSAGPSAKELLAVIERENVPVYYSCALAEVLDDGIVVKNLVTGENESYAADSVLLASGMTPTRETADALRHCAPETEIFVIGDAVRAATISEAVNEAFRICIHI